MTNYSPPSFVQLGRWPFTPVRLSGGARTQIFLERTNPLKELIFYPRRVRDVFARRSRSSVDDNRLIRSHGKARVAAAAISITRRRFPFPLQRGVKRRRNSDYFAYIWQEGAALLRGERSGKRERSAPTGAAGRGGRVFAEGKL